jgi:hypothetical protein
MNLQRLHRLGRGKKWWYLLSSSHSRRRGEHNLDNVSLYLKAHSMPPGGGTSGVWLSIFVYRRSQCFVDCPSSTRLAPLATDSSRAFPPPALKMSERTSLLKSSAEPKPVYVVPRTNSISRVTVENVKASPHCKFRGLLPIELASDVLGHICPCQEAIYSGACRPHSSQCFIPYAPTTRRAFAVSQQHGVLGTTLAICLPGYDALRQNP